MKVARGGGERGGGEDEDDRTAAEVRWSWRSLAENVRVVPGVRRLGRRGVRREEATGRREDEEEETVAVRENTRGEGSRGWMEVGEGWFVVEGLEDWRSSGRKGQVER